MKYSLFILLMFVVYGCRGQAKSDTSILTFAGGKTINGVYPQPLTISVGAGVTIPHHQYDTTKPKSDTMTAGLVFDKWVDGVKCDTILYLSTGNTYTAYTPPAQLLTVSGGTFFSPQYDTVNVICLVSDTTYDTPEFARQWKAKMVRENLGWTRNDPNSRQWTQNFRIIKYIGLDTRKYIIWQTKVVK